MTPRQQAAMDVVYRAANGGEAILSREDAKAIIDMLADPRIYEEITRKQASWSKKP